MHERGLQLPIQCPHLPDDMEKVEWIEAAAPPIERMQTEPVSFDLRPAAIQMCCNMDLVTGRKRGMRHRQPVRQEIPVLGDEIDNDRFRPWRHDSRSSMFQTASALFPGRQKNA